MLKHLLPILILLARAAPATRAQTSCALPVLKVVLKSGEVTAAGAPWNPLVTLRVGSAADCPEPVRYRFKDAQVSLIRNGRPVLPTLLISQPWADLSVFTSSCRPCDHLYVLIPFQNLIVVDAAGNQRPYGKPKAKTGAEKLDITTDEFKGVVFKWLLTRQ
ncbi:hypothetical protein [Hymenobacter algoricola]|uniref:Lipoprotein n=1 Tax=Hymenobacter algoricola TaxID=486267 RepID=A0ABP7MS29_9BACT